MNVVSLTDAREKKLSAGFCPVPNEIIEALAGGKLAAREFQIVAAVIRKTFGWGKDADRVAASQLAELTGIRRQECSMLLCRLIERKIITRQGGSRGPIQVNPNLDEWTEREKSTQDNISGRVTTKTELSSLTTKHSHSVTTDVRHTIDKKDTINTPSEYLSETDSDQPAAKSDSRKSKYPPCPTQKIVDLYHEILPELPRCVRITSKRQSQIKARWKETFEVPAQGGGTKIAEAWDLDFWRKYFLFIRRNDFLMGNAPAGHGYDRPFQASLQWVTTAENMARILEGTV
jgi:phage replication O-like protein O